VNLSGSNSTRLASPLTQQGLGWLWLVRTGARNGLSIKAMQQKHVEIFAENSHEIHSILTRF